MRFRLAQLCALTACVCWNVSAQNAAAGRVGPLEGGGYLLNNGWTLRPAGEQIPVDTFPMSSAVSTDGKYLLVLNGGIHPPSISVVDLAAKKEVGRTALPDAWLGLVAGSSGNLYYAGGGSSGRVYELSLDENGKLTRTREFALAPSKAPGAPFAGDVALSPDGRVLYAADLYGDSIAQINLQSGKVVDHWKTGRRPYRIVVSPDGAQLMVSSWAEAAVYEHESGTGVLIRKMRVGTHPTDMLWINKPFTAESGGASYVGRLFIAASNTNTVFAFGVTQDGQFSALDPINVSLTPMHPLGMTPSALSADAQGRQLYVACSDANVVAVVDISVEHPTVPGYIPTGWYPTAIRTLSDGRLIVLNGKGTQTGTAEMIAQPTPLNLEGWTRTTAANSPYRDELIYGPIRDRTEAYFSRTQEHASPIQHVIYVIKGSTGYEQFAKDNSTPNLHELAHEFVTYEDFYSNGETQWEGQNWAAAAIAPDYTVKLSASAAAGRSKVKDFEGGEPANTPPAGYLWSNAMQAGLTVRNYGEWVSNIPAAQAVGQRQVQAVNDQTLAAVTDLNFRGADPSYKDVDRAAEFIREWKEFDSKGQAPQLSIVRLSNDAEGSGGLTDNDRAIGLLADAVSHSKLWQSTAVFIVEASAPDYHSPAWVVSPYTRRGTIDRTMFNDTGMLRTIELILGLRPMTAFDAAGKSMFSSFTETPNAQAFAAKK